MTIDTPWIKSGLSHRRPARTARSARAALAACGGATELTLSLLGETGGLAAMGLAEVVPLLLLVPEGGAGGRGSGEAEPVGEGLLRFDPSGAGPTLPPAA